MSHALTEADVYTASIVVPDAGDPRSATSVEEGMQDLADRTNFIRQRAEGIKIGYSRLVPLAAGHSTAGFDWGVSGGLVWEQTATPGGVAIALPVIEGVTGAKLTSLAAWFRPSSGHGGFTLTQPSLALWRQPADGTVPVQLATITLTAASLVAYEAAQVLALTLGGGSGIAIDMTQAYYAVFTGEGGASFASGLQLTMIRITTNPA